MPYRSNREAVTQALRRDAAGRANRQRDAHFETVDREVPRDTGLLASTLEKGGDATPQRLATSVRIGDERTPYTAAVNDGHILRNGEFWPGYHFWEAGEEAGRSTR